MTLDPKLQGQRVAVVGAGLAASVLAHGLQRLGAHPTVFEKARGPGGRLSTRRTAHTPAQGEPLTLHHDHGAQALQPEGDPAWSDTLQGWAQAGWLGPWHGAWVPQPDMPALCRQLLQGIPVHSGATVQPLRPPEGGPWSLHTAEGEVHLGFDAVLVTAPPPQAAALVQALRPDWQQALAQWVQDPVWALMLWTLPEKEDAPACLEGPPGAAWSLAVRVDSKPGRTPHPGGTPWVVHARREWSAREVNTPATEVQAQLLAALAEGQPQRFAPHRVLQVMSHRWLYGFTRLASRRWPAGLDEHSHCAWDATLRLGLASDAWVDGSARGAWRSAQALLQRMSA